MIIHKDVKIVNGREIMTAYDMDENGKITKKEYPKYSYDELKLMMKESSVVH